MCQTGIDYKGLMLALKQLSSRENSLRKDIEAWADYYLEQGAAEEAAELRKAAEASFKAAESLAKVNHSLEHLNGHTHDHQHDHDNEHTHDHDHHHVTATHFSGTNE